jgi:hypothetical protein
MPTLDPRIDAYIAASAGFAQPILAQLRALVHAACPDVEETMKWSFPHFQYKGMLCGMAAFKAHCKLGFWKGELLRGGADAGTLAVLDGLERIGALAELPAQARVRAIIAAAMALNDADVKAPSRAKKPVARPLEVPADLLAALAAAPPALAHFNAFNTSSRRDYADWLAEAKTEATRQRRLAQAVAQCAEGKTRNWKYAKC